MNVDYVIPKLAQLVENEPIAAYIAVSQEALDALDAALTEWPTVRHIVRNDEEIVHMCIRPEHWVVYHDVRPDGEDCVSRVERVTEGNGKVAFVRNVADTLEA